MFLSSSTSAMLAMIPARFSGRQYKAATGKAKHAGDAGQTDSRGCAQS